MIIRVWIDFRVKIRGSSRKKIFDRLGNISIFICEVINIVRIIVLIKKVVFIFFENVYYIYEMFFG